MFCSSPESRYTSLPATMSPDRRTILRTPAPVSPESETTEEISPPKDPFLLLIVGPGKLAATPSRVRMSLAEEEWQVSPPRDPEILAATGAGELATRPIRVREPLDSEYYNTSDGEEDQSEGYDPDASLEPIQILYFHPELDEWRPRRPVVSKVVKKNQGIIDGDEKNDKEEKTQTKTPTKHKKPRWRASLGFFRSRQSGRGTKERIQERRAFLLPNMLISFA